MSAAHTPGPWFADVGETAVIRDAHGNQLAIFTHLNTRTGGRRDADEVARNCRTAAAAPELLDALKKITEWFEREDHAQGYCCCGMRMDTHGNPMDEGHVAVDAGEYHAGLLIEACRAAKAKATGVTR